MFKKITAILLTVIVVACFMCGCRFESEKPPVTATPTVVPPGSENGNATDITTAGFSVDTIKVGDKISVFTVAEADIKKLPDGSLGSATIKFTGSLAIRGNYSVVSGNDMADFVILEEYTEYLPCPDSAKDGLKTIGLSVTVLNDIYGEQTSGYAAVVIESYSLTYSTEDGEWHAVATDFVKDTNEYVVMQ